MFVIKDITRIQNVIDCAQLELTMWDFLNPRQRESLEKKIQQMQDQLKHVQTYLERSS